MTLTLPAGLERQRRLGPAWGRWLDTLPRRCTDLLGEWELDRDGDELWHGFCSLVVPVLTRQGERSALKISFDEDDESEHEHLALQRWGGDGAVRLLRADPRHRAMLLERLGREDLDRLDDVEACEVVAGLWARLHVPALPQLRTLTSYVGRWTDALAALPRHAPVPRRYVDQAVSLSRDLESDPGSIGTLIHGDLHYQNVLSAEREPWLVIDPKPMSGDRHYEVAPLLWNRFDELAGDVREGIRRRFFALVDAGGLDEDRARAWVVVRMLHNISWDIEDGDPDPDRLTMMIAIAKAVQD